MKLYAILFASIFAANLTADKKHPDLTACSTPPVKNASSAKCIALREGASISLVGVFGGVWDVVAKKQGDFWFIYPKKANSLVTLDTLLMKIEVETGKASYQK